MTNCADDTAKRSEFRRLAGNVSLIQRVILQYCDEAVKDSGEAKLLSAVLAQAYSDMSLPLGTDRMSAERFFDDGTARPFCEWLGFSYETAMFWRARYALSPSEDAKEALVSDCRDRIRREDRSKKARRTDGIYADIFTEHRPIARPPAPSPDDGNQSTVVETD